MQCPTEPAPPKRTAPLDGYGPRGAPDCYYTSRVLDSTARYAKFVRKLRALEEEQAKGAANALKDLTDKQNNDFFIRCDRRSLINNVARRVDLCLSSYEQDLVAKRHRLLNLLTQEEEMNIRKFVEQAQAGAEALWQDKKDRLAYLLAKRQKEHEEKYKDIPIDKCVHVQPCIVRMRADEVQQCQLYQMKEKEAKKMAELELDKMWHEVAMKESEALAARMEQDAIERLRRNQECLKYTREQIAARQEQRRKEQEILKQESLRMMSIFKEQARQAEEEKRLQQEKRIETGRERMQMMKERQAILEKQRMDEQLLNDTWDSLAGMGLSDENAKKELNRQKRREIDICNYKLLNSKDKQSRVEADDIAAADAKRIQDLVDKRRCEQIKKNNAIRDECQAALKQQIKDNAADRELKAKQHADYVEYQNQLSKQLDQLVAHKELTLAQARKLHESNLKQQIEYNSLLKKRQMEEDLQQMEKCEAATKEYDEAILTIMSRKYFSEDVHPFWKQITKPGGLKMQEKCPCSKPDYCAVPVLGPKGASKPGAPESK